MMIIHVKPNRHLIDCLSFKLSRRQTKIAVYVGRTERQRHQKEAYRCKHRGLCELQRLCPQHNPLYINSPSAPKHRPPLK